MRRRMSELVGDDARYDYANVGLGSNSYLALAHVFVENLIMNYVTKLQFPVSRPIDEALLGAPDDLDGAEGWVGTNTTSDYRFVQRPPFQLRVLSLLTPEYFQQLTAYPFRVTTFGLRDEHPEIASK
jgi:hypothetical protein